ncbi:hypothetical protein [Pseudomonas sp. F1002]|uniref:hypothetical protein n=1 Tax=Pseudomonas sp. F1002 TaxID=2738821 RepID=UPI0015A3144D|nr:hypothetical protein [Pseudomonas sp. F1002]NWB64307.1 hypothetical protein [Pseudomonas sp. F1002]
MNEDNDLKASTVAQKKEQRWRVACEKTDDGSGGVIVTIPNELCSYMVWTIRTTLSVQPGFGNTLVLSKKMTLG